MKVCIIQPPYSRDTALSQEYFQYKLDCLARCDESIDLIVLPEYSDVPCATATLEETLFWHETFIGPLLTACAETARRCGALVFVNALSHEPEGWRNTTYVYDRSGAPAGKYFKKHLPPLENEVLRLDGSYTLTDDEPYILELDGLRFGFLTCYDFYFYEAFAAIARCNADILIGCSLQRSDTHDAIETMCRFLAYNTNAWVVRSSVSFAEDSDICGASMVVSPTGRVLTNMKGRFGMETVEFDPADKHYKPAGYGNSPAAHHEYIEYGRRPWQYRNAGPGTALFEELMSYPRICAHRGFSTVAPENSLPAFGAAVAMGAQEIEFDLWPTADGEIVSCHDATLERVSDGEGFIWEHTLAELKALDFGAGFGEKFRGLRIPTFAEILQRLGGRTVMNIHVKPLPDRSYDPAAMKKIVALLRRYDCTRHCYFMLERDDDILAFKEYAPEIPVCVGHDFARSWAIVDRAIALGAQKVQFFKPYFNQEMIDKAHAHGIRCNIFWADDPDEARRYLDMGIDTVLTNEYNLVAQVLEER